MGPAPRWGGMPPRDAGAGWYSLNRPGPASRRMTGRPVARPAAPSRRRLQQYQSFYVLTGRASVFPMAQEPIFLKTNAEPSFLCP